ncbi:MAG: anti-sigma factor family protein, partial [Ktedonobacteraceae bacterium]
MDCNQARTTMSAYRELKSGELDTIELDAHLAGCATCRDALASYTQIGESVRAVPLCAPPPDLRAKLMRALAEEQMKMLQKSAPGKVPTPEFLKPYIQEKAQNAPSHDEMVALSTAKTGPLPLMPRQRKRRSVQVNQFAVLGMVAAILILLMTGGLTSLLMLARGNPTSLGTISSNISRPSDVFLRKYTPQTLYPNVASAIPTNDAIYYTAYRSDINSDNWMLMQFDRDTQTGQPLLATPGSSPLLVLSVSNNWLVWLEYSRPQTIARGNWFGNDSHHSPQRAWSLHFLSLLPPTT